MAPRSSPALVNQWFANPSKDLLSGLVVAFAMIPEAIAFSATAISTVNITGGFIVTKKMLDLFKRPEDPPEFYETYGYPV